MALGPGARLGSYEIQAAIGAGGMGEVYRARDTRLKRDVALKLLPESFASDADRLARFQREAEVLASLNHPNIAAIYGIEESTGARALVIELVDGPTLADRIAQGPIPVDEALPVAKQIAEALEAAHEQGIIHRDLKPANIKVRPDGTVKVLDFGLAKALDPASTSTVNVNATASPTITSPAMMTGVGVLLGTAAYMSPEQARGKAVDKRTDIWAFGCVLYEMLTGQHAFAGEDVADTIGAVIHKDPDWSLLPPTLSPTVRAVLQRCLQKHSNQRMRDVGDIRLVLDGAFDSGATAQTYSAVSRARAARPWRLIAAATSVVAIVTLTVAVWLLISEVPPPVVRLIADHPGPDMVGGVGRDVAIAADGRRITYVTTGGGQRHIHVRALDQLSVTQLIAGNPLGVFMSPDGQWIGFAEGENLKKIAVTGGPAITICKLKVSAFGGASWGPDDTIIFSYGTRGQGLWRVSAAGGDPEPLTTPDAQNDESRHQRPDILPSAQAVLFENVPETGVEDAQILLHNLRTGQQKVLIRGGTNVRYAPSGHLVYLSGETLHAARFDLDRLEVIGNPVPIPQSVKLDSSGAASFAIAPNGTLVYIQHAGQNRRTLVWVDRQGREEPIDVPAGGYVYPRISPDGTQVALDIRNSVEDGDIWVWNLARTTVTRLTFGQGMSRTPVWSPDGKRIAFLSNRGGGPTNIFWQAADGTGAAERLTETSQQHVPSSFSPDGTRLVFRSGAGANLDLEVLSLGDRQVDALVRTPFIDQNGEISPNGQWLAYESNESGQFQVYVRPFPEVERGRWQVSTIGGTRPLWARNGRELFYLAPSGALMAIPISVGPSFSAGTPIRLFEGRYFEVQRTLNTSQIVGRTYDISADGRRFLMIKDATPPGEAAVQPHIVVVLNWHEELKRLVPVD